MLASRLSFLIFLVQLTWVCAERSLSISLGGPSEVESVDNLIVVANVTNMGNEEIKLYKDPQSVLSKFPGNSFIFTGDNIASFIGALAYYSFDSVTDFIVLQPGESTSVSHNLAAAYNFTAPGTYNIDANRNFYYYDPETQKAVSILATSSGHTVKLSGSLTSVIYIKRETNQYKRSDPLHDGESLKKRFSYSNTCTSNQVSDLQEALPSCAGYVTDAINYFSQGVTGPRFTEWFGPCTNPSFANVLGHYEKIQSSNPNTYQYTCCVDSSCGGCHSGIVAYVNGSYPSVYLCPPFWTYPSTGAGSMAGIILHEASHFAINGGTHDIKYGKTDAHSLALNSPTDAMNNADNYRFFAENSPPLS